MPAASALWRGQSPELRADAVLIDRSRDFEADLSRRRSRRNCTSASIAGWCGLPDRTVLAVRSFDRHGAGRRRNEMPDDRRRLRRCVSRRDAAARAMDGESTAATPARDGAPPLPAPFSHRRINAGEFRTRTWMLDLARLSRAELEAMAEAARVLAACEAALRAAALGCWARRSAGADAPSRGGTIPPAMSTTRARMRNISIMPTRPGERGAASTGISTPSCGARGMPPGMRPLVLPELAIADNPRHPRAAAPSAPQPHEEGDPWCHLVALAIERGRAARSASSPPTAGSPGETWYRAGDVAAMLDRFAIGQGRAVAAARSLDHRDDRRFPAADRGTRRGARQAVMGWRRRRRGKVHVFDDRRLEITSSLDIDARGAAPRDRGGAARRRVRRPQTRPRCSRLAHQHVVPQHLAAELVAHAAGRQMRRSMPPRSGSVSFLQRTLQRQERGLASVGRRRQPRRRPR